MIGTKAASFESYLGEVAPKSKTLLQSDNPQVKQDIERFREVKALFDRAEKLEQEAKKTRIKLQKQSLRIRAASLTKQAQEKVPEEEGILSQRYPELKGTVMSRISGSLRYLEYSLERFLQLVPSQIQQHESEEPSQSPLEGFLEVGIG